MPSVWFLAYFLLHLAVYSLIRLEFLIWNRASLRNLSNSDILWAFVNGLRFDLSVLAATVGLCFLGLVFVGGFRRLRQIWIGIFIALNALLFLLNTGEVELYNFTAKRFTVSSFFLIGEGSVGNLLWPYIPLASASIALVVLYIYVAWKISRRFQYNYSLWQKIGAGFLVLILGVLFSRGGFQHKPLTYVDAKLFDNSYANNLVLNSTFTILKSIGKPGLARVNYFSDRDEMLSLLNAQDISSVITDADARKTKLNVVLVILESFSYEYLSLQNPEPTPYFNQLRRAGVDFTNAYANGRRSIEGVAAILSGIPALMEEPFINSEFSSNEVIGVGTRLGAEGYHTSFFHGAANGSMHFDRFSKSVGVEHYFGLNEYPNSGDNDGTWGIFDEPFLQWTCGQLTGFKQPFFSTIFTLSSHQPYNLPGEYRERFTDDRLPILKSIRYADHALQKFMECAEKQDWYKNTVFVFTADHTGPELGNETDFASRYRVPLVLYRPGDTVLPRIPADQYAQHIDMLPTLLDYLGMEQKNRNYLARSLLRPGPKVIALYSDGHYELVGQVTDKERQLQAVQQYFSEGLYDNRLYYPSK